MQVLHRALKLLTASFLHDERQKGWGYVVKTLSQSVKYSLAEWREQVSELIQPGEVYWRIMQDEEENQTRFLFHPKPFPEYVGDKRAEWNWLCIPRYLQEKQPEEWEGPLYEYGGGKMRHNGIPSVSAPLYNARSISHDTIAFGNYDGTLFRVLEQKSGLLKLLGTIVALRLIDYKQDANLH